jgi:hypothetical protein
MNAFTRASVSGSISYLSFAPTGRQPRQSRFGQASLRPVAAAQQVPPHLGQDVDCLVE